MAQLFTAAHVTKTKSGATLTHLYKDGKKVALVTPSGIRLSKELPERSMWWLRVAVALATDADK